MLFNKYFLFDSAMLFQRCFVTPKCKKLIRQCCSTNTTLSTYVRALHEGERNIQVLFSLSPTPARCFSPVHGRWCCFAVVEFVSSLSCVPCAFLFLTLKTRNMNWWHQSSVLEGNNRNFFRFFYSLADFLLNYQPVNACHHDLNACSCSGNSWTKQSLQFPSKDRRPCCKRVRDAIQRSEACNRRSLL